MANRTDIDETLMDRQGVLEVLKTNRAAHRDLYEKAMEGYKIQVTEFLEERLEQIKNNDPKQVTLNLPLPEDHTGDYDEIIGMLEANQADEILLQQHDYRTYILDKWGWSDAWTTSNTAYVGAASQ